MKHEDQATLRFVIYALVFAVVMAAITLWMGSEPEPVFTYGYRNTLTETVMEAR